MPTLPKPCLGQYTRSSPPSRKIFVLPNCTALRGLASQTALETPRRLANFDGQDETCTPSRRVHIILGILHEDNRALTSYFRFKKKPPREILLGTESALFTRFHKVLIILRITSGATGADPTWGAPGKKQGGRKREGGVAEII